MTYGAMRFAYCGLRAACGLQPEHEQHRLATQLAKLRRVDERGFRVPAEPGQDRHILLAAELESHRRRVEARADIDLPKLIEARVVVGRERSVDEAGEEEAASRGEGGAAVRVRLFCALSLAT